MSWKARIRVTPDSVGRIAEQAEEMDSYAESQANVYAALAKQVSIGCLTADEHARVSDFLATLNSVEWTALSIAFYVEGRRLVEEEDG